MQETEKRISWLLWLMALSVLVVVAAAFYFYYFKKDYDFIVETSCDPTMEVCFQIECEGEDCPDGVYSFNRYKLEANDFAQCENEDCEAACAEHVISCEEVSCEPDILAGESCSAISTE